MPINALDRILHAEGPCVTISLKTHRTHPDNLTDAIRLKNLHGQAVEKLIGFAGDRETAGLRQTLQALVDDIDVNYNLDSLHILVSPSYADVIRSPYPVPDDTVEVADHFAMLPLIKMLNRTHTYLIMVLSQSGVPVYRAVNNRVIYEVENADFPFEENPYYLESEEQKSDPKLVDAMVSNYFNKVDKALVGLHNRTGLSCVVICTDDNYRRLLEVANKPEAYLGYFPINYNDTGLDTIGKQAWQVIEEKIQGEYLEALQSVQDAIGQGKVYTDLGDIYRAAAEGRADLLLTSPTFRQPARVDNGTIELLDEPGVPGAVDDLINEIALNVLAHRGQVLITQPEDMENLGNVALKVRW